MVVEATQMGLGKSREAGDGLRSRKPGLGCRMRKSERQA